jgi:hypothetical protein
MVVTASSHPTLFSMFVVVANDIGAPVLDGFDVTDRIADVDLDKVEVAATALTPEQRETMCNGEQEEIEALAAQVADGELIDTVLARFFEMLEEQALPPIEEEGHDA